MYKHTQVGRRTIGILLGTGGSHRRKSVLLTNASRRLSGDQDGTLIVP